MKKTLFFGLTRGPAVVSMVVAVAFGLSACGEYSQVVQYKPGNYQGKSDTRPWEGGKFAGDKAAWESALQSRNQNQNEYKKAN